MYTVQATAYDPFVLLVGITPTILAYFAIVVVQSVTIALFLAAYFAIVGYSLPNNK